MAVDVDIVYKPTWRERLRLFFGVPMRVALQTDRDCIWTLQVATASAKPDEFRTLASLGSPPDDTYQEQWFDTSEVP